ncbi:hypothetical protein V6N11_031675 [Hibiscus sabdariffa]|uniref:NADH:ubiquinone reductase (non-electrogenic) n=1 Tax=Hibiscus sabdariffa TaxID=183260 RepID=A0ABR2SYY0_9ROSI
MIQVANQQGAYLAKCFNRMEECEKNPEGPPRFRGTGRHRFHPFRYKHLGQFAPLGGEKIVTQLPGDWVSIGHSSQWLWYSIYARGNRFGRSLAWGRQEGKEDQGIAFVQVRFCGHGSMYKQWGGTAEELYMMYIGKVSNYPSL